MSNYVKTGALGFVPASTISTNLATACPSGYRPSMGKCYNTTTGAVYKAPEKEEPSQLSRMFDYLGDQAKTIFGGTTMPQSTYSAPSLVLPAVLVVGGVGLLLILKKKK